MEETTIKPHALLLKAVEYAAEKHIKIRRKNADKDPYINHPIGVAHIILTVGKVDNVDALCGGILHDTVEDTSATIEEIQKIFGKKIADIVADVSDNKTLTKVKRKKQQIEHAKHACYEAKLVKLADKLHNLSSLLKDPPSKWSTEIIRGYFVWSSFVVKALSGTNEPMEKELSKVFASEFEHNGKKYSCLPSGSLDDALESYYQLIENEEKPSVFSALFSSSKKE